MDAVGTAFLGMEGQDTEIEEFCIGTSSSYLEGVCLLDDPRFNPAFQINARAFSTILSSGSPLESESVLSFSRIMTNSRYCMAGMPWWFLLIEGALALLGKALPKWIRSTA
jgi:hypothetical protein